ncbi:MAG: fused MFS/spermidine synthase [Nitrospirae bacterium]|nr:fused MFS/spermidine synthase [Nitrospirota bacterium]
MLTLAPHALIQTRLRRAIFLCFFLSGAAGLIYEIVWIRMLGLVFGHTVYAITTVLVAFMGGLGLGSFLGGRLADRTRNLLKIYGRLEIGIGVYCVLTPWLMDVVKAVYLGLARSMDLPFGVYTLIQFFLAALIIVIPTTLMGATLPILTRFSARELGTVGRLVGALYAVNTFGAVLGTYLAGFELLPLLGMRTTLIVAAGLNIAIGGAILFIDRRVETSGVPQEEEAPEPAMAQAPEVPPVSQLVAWWLMVGFALSGSASMIYEIAWTRALTLIIGSSTYAFSAMLLSFLVGIAAGSAWFARRATRAPVTPAWFAALQVGIALSAAAVFPLFDRLPDVFLQGFRISQAPGFILWLQVALSVAVMLAPTFCIGATFPCVAQIFATDRARIGSRVGWVYAGNTLGAIVGAFVAGFLLIPWIGVEATIRSGLAINLAVGLTLVMAWASTMRTKLVAGAGLVVGLVAVTLLPTWDRQVMSSGVSVYATRYASNPTASSWREKLHAERLLYYKDGISATVTVHQAEGQTILRVNGKADASSVSDLHTQLMLGHLPAILHPNPKTAFVIGLGSGVTVGALAQYPIDRIDVAEIEPAVVEASDFFSLENRRALSDPRVHTSSADGRNFLLMTPARYDLIISEPSNPWISGVATLFTVEFLDVARRHLAPDGIMIQWVHGYVMAPEDLRMVIASFRTVFPHATLWRTQPGDYLLVGTLTPLVVDLDRVRDVYAANPSVRHDMKRIKFPSAEVLLADFYLDEQELARLTAGAPLNTDDRLPLEFSAPRNLYRDTIEVNADMLRAVKSSGFPPLRGRHLEDLDRPAVQFDLAIGLVAKQYYEDARRHLDNALAKDPKYAQALVLRGWLHKLANRYPEALQDFQAALRINPKDAGTHQQLGLLYLRQKKMDDAVAALKQAVALDPKNPGYADDLATALNASRPQTPTVVR